MNTPIGAAASSTTPRLNTGIADPAASIAKLTVNDSRTVDGVTATSTLTPRLTTWLHARRDSEAKVEVEILGRPTKSIKANKANKGKRLIWSGQATAKPNDSQVTLQVPKGLLQDGEKVRWRARAGDNGAWSPWAGLAVDLEQGATADKTSNGPRGIAPAPAAALADDDSRVQECWRNEQRARTSAQDGTDGYYMNRNTWCAIHQLVRGNAQINSRPGILVNGIIADATILGTAGSNGAENPTKNRFSRFKISLKNVTAFGGVYSTKAMIAFGVSTYNTACKIDGDSYVQSPWQQWRDGKVVEFSVVSDEANGGGIDKVERCFPKFYAKIWLDGISTTPPKTYWSDARPEARCDSARYLTKWYGSGCIFDKVAAVYETTETRPGVPWSGMGDPDNVNMAYRSVASHIWTAQHKKELTLPKRADKSIPGHWLGASGPLSRNVNAKWKIKNNEKSRNMCRLLFKDYDRKDAELGKGPKHKVYECDEFPFQSTMQGTWVSVERLNSPDAYAYSIRPVWWKRNTEDGLRLGAFYGSRRILGEDGTRRKTTYDHFWVEAHVPGQNPH